MTSLLISLWHGGLLVPILVGFCISIYCFIRYSKNRSPIPLVIGILIAVLSGAGLVALLLDK